MTPLKAVQSRIVGLLGFPETIDQGLGMQSEDAAFKMGEP
jgi:hypothetical protein